MIEMQAINFEDLNRNLFFVNDSPICRKRVNSFFTKEPDTVEWLKTLTKEDVLWDIGANIGIYSLPASLYAKRVYAFEPMLANFKILSDNVLLNKIENVIPVHVALSDREALGELRVSDGTSGAAMNSISDIGYKGADVSKNRREPVFEMTGRFFQRYFDADLPTAIKLDVDGVEERVLHGIPMLRVRKAIIEVDSTNVGQFGSIMQLMDSYDFKWDHEQALRSRRREGPNAGVGNIIFRR